MKISGIIIVLALLSNAPLLAQETFKKRFINHSEIGALFGRVRYTENTGTMQDQVVNRTNISLQTFNGIQLTRRFATGVTLGVDWYKSAIINPVAAGIRYDLFYSKGVAFFGTFDGGYGLTLLQADPAGYHTDGGWMLNPGIGLRAGKPGNAAFTFSISYKRQESYVKKPILFNQIERFEDRVYNRLALRMGISF